MKPSDLELLRAFAQSGDDAPFAQLLDRHRGWLFAAARRRLDDDHLADDATQAVFMVLASKSQQLVTMERGSIRAWLFHVMHLTCTRLRRTRSRQSHRELSAGILRHESGNSLPDSDLRTLLDDAISQLPPDDRDAIVRRFYESADLTSVGEALDISADAARKRISRALAVVKELMLRDGIDAIPDELLAAKPMSAATYSLGGNKRIDSLAKGTMIMMTQMEAIDFAVMSAEFFVKDVEANLDFFEKLGFRRHFLDTPDAMGRLPRASLRGGKFARIWLRRADETDGRRPAPGITLFYWINGGAEGLIAHRNAIAAQGVTVSPFFDDITLRNFTVTSPDGYSIGFFTSYK